MASIRAFLVPPVVVGVGAAARVGEEAKKLHLKKGLIVTDAVMVKLPAMEGIARALAQSDLEYAIYDGVNAEPALEMVREGLGLFKNNSCDFIVAIGGGSPIDAAKAISVMVTNTGSIDNYQGAGKILNPGVPLIAIPTTAGTGSEVTPFTIITDTQRTVKMLISSHFVMPRLAIVDPLMTLTCPPGITASVGIDALTHAIEAYVSLKAQPLSDIFCLSAIQLISTNLRRAWADGNDLEAREKTMLGALQAGIAFSNSSVALVHGMSRPVGAYFHVPHGASNAALLPLVMEFSYIGNPVRYAQIARAMGEDTVGKADLEAARLAVKAVEKLAGDVRVSSLRQLGIDPERLQQLAPRMTEDAIASGSPANNPRQATREEIIELYQRACLQ
ncbi:MAG: iron-containing alcohol dehydrogenase [Chloroflexi bacterium]|nr:iron-containing alcohol dehydrogenase [Chloroflexota bacterium]